MRFLVPKLPPRDLGRMLLMSVCGAMVAGAFGVIHDQLTFSLSAEYFTRMKFDQFRYADLGLPPRVFVAQIGFLATWWVGLITAWFLARLIVPNRPRGIPWKILGWGFAWIAAGTVFCGTLGFFIWPGLMGQSATHMEALDAIGVTDQLAFHQVSGIHLGSYLGASISWLIVVWRMRKITRQPTPQ